MISLEFNDAMLAQEVSGYYGKKEYYLEPGWYDLTITGVTEPVTRDGIVQGKIILCSESGVEFPLFATYSVQYDKDAWRVSQTQQLIIRICQATGFKPTGVNDLPNLVGKKIRANVMVRETKKNFVDPVTMQTTEKIYKNNDIAKGKLNEVIQPVTTTTNDNFNFTFGG